MVVAAAWVVVLADGGIVGTVFSGFLVVMGHLSTQVAMFNLYPFLQ